jgi:amino acid transporter
MGAAKTKEGLKRVIGVPGFALIIVNGTIGAGIFALPAIVSMQLGAFGIYAYIFSCILMATIMLCYMEIGTKITSSGGSYAYVETAFGKYPGFIINSLFLFGWGLLGSAAIINILADSLSVLSPVFTNIFARALLFFVSLGLIVLINVRGTKQSVGFLKVMSLIKLLPLFAIIIFGFSHIKASNLHWENLPSLKSFGNTVLVLMFAVAGFETTLNVSGEIKNSKRTVPLGILLGGLLVYGTYMLLQTVTQGVIGDNISAVKDAPLAAVADQIVGPAGATILLLAAAISCFGLLSGIVLAIPRLLFAGANDGLFPKFLGKVHPKFATPYIAIIVYAILIFIFSLTGGFKQLAVLASASLLIIYLSVILATIKMRKVKQEVPEKTFRIPGGLIIPFIGIAAIIWLLTSLGKWEILSVIIFIAVLSLIYLVMRKVQMNSEL